MIPFEGDRPQQPPMDEQLELARFELDLSLLSAQVSPSGELDLETFHQQKDVPTIGDRIGTAIANVVFAPFTLFYGIKELRTAKRGEPTLGSMLESSRKSYDNMLIDRHAKLIRDFRSDGPTS